MRKQTEFIYLENQRFFAQVADDVDDLAVQELEALGAERVSPAYRGVYFTADSKTLYRINYMARTITRVLAPLVSFHCPDTDTLYKETGRIYWPDLFKLDNTFAVFANIANSRITHSKYAALCLKDAVVDQFRSKFRKRPSINAINPNLWLNLYINKDKATISLDTSGGSMHRRGYRKASLEAPMQETLAASIIKMSEWNGDVPLYDPMCGAGTLLSEAHMHYCQIPSGYLRGRFGFQFMPDFDKQVWDLVKKEADENIRPLPEGLISGSDMSPHAVEAARMNNSTLPHGDSIKFVHQQFQDISDLKNTMIVCNPPYGLRMGKRENVNRLIKDLGDFLKQRCQGSSAYLYFGDRELIKKVGLKPSWKKPLKNGGLDGRLVKYEMY